VNRKTAVVLLNMGGPDSLEAIRPFLENLFSDPEILRAPLGLLRKPLARWIAGRRSRRVVHNYEAIGGKSPLREITEAQGRSLLDALGGKEAGYSVHVAMRYWHPRADEAARGIASEGAERIVVLPLYPQFCRATTGSSQGDLDRALAFRGLGKLPRSVIRSWQDFPPYADALAETVREGMEGVPGATVVLSAHGIPVRLVNEGDPYLEHVRATAAALGERLPGVGCRLAFQSRAGPVRWIEPYLPQTIEALAREGVKSVLVVPLSFVSDHIETLHELDIETRDLAHRLGIREFRRAPALNTRPAFIRALAELVRSRL